MPITSDTAIMTGGTGFVGSWMVKRRPPINVGILNRDSYENFNILESIENIQYIIHLAPTSPTRALACAKRLGIRLLYASSGAVYHPEYQHKEYRQAKIDGERQCLDSGVDVVIARLFTFMRSSVAWKTIFSDIRNGKEPTVYRGCTRSFMLPSEMARWMWAVLLNGESGQAYDVGSDRAITMVDFAMRIFRFTGCPSWVNHERVPMPVYLPENTAKTRELL